MVSIKISLMRSRHVNLVAYIYIVYICKVRGRLCTQCLFFYYRYPLGFTNQHGKDVAECSEVHRSSFELCPPQGHVREGGSDWWITRVSCNDFSASCFLVYTVCSSLYEYYRYTGAPYFAAISAMKAVS